MPVAEPSGEYTATCSVDLSPLFGNIVREKKITINQPPADILDKRLAELRSDDERTRLMAVSDLAYFEKDGKRVFPALKSCFESGGENMKNAALSSMRSFTAQIAAHSDFFVKILGDGKLSEMPRLTAARYLASHAPIGDRIQKALVEGNEALKESRYGASFKYYLQQYERRKKEVTD